MKYLFSIFFLTFFLFSCGPSKEEIARQKRIEDSLLEIERNTALDNANKLLDSSLTESVDTIKEVKE